MAVLHSLLRRQLKRCFGDDVPSELEALLSVVSQAYEQLDADRAMLERSLDLSSQELMLANEDLRTVFQAIPDLFVRVSEAGTICGFKAGADLIAGTELDGFIGLRVDDARIPDALRRLAEPLERVRVTGERMQLEYSVAFDGSERHLEARLLPLPNRQVIAMVRSITERKQMEARLFMSDRLASVGTLAAGVAHEINNPLAFVSANLSVAQEQLATLTANDLAASPRTQAVVASVRDALGDAATGSERVRAIVRELKVFSRADDDPRNEPIDLEEVLESAIKISANEIRHRATLVRRFEKVRHVWGNEARLSQVFLNLLINAAQAIPVGALAEHRVEVTLRARDPGTIVVEISDTGHGIQPEIIDRIFDPFFTTKPVGIGTGLGLSICRGIVVGAGGDITVRNLPSGGACFEVRLRAVEEEAPALAPPPAVVPPPATIRARVLIVDDEPLVGKSVKRALQDLHDVVVVGSARAALELLRDGHTIDLILCDLMMPEMTGMELHAALGVEDRERMVFLTGGAFTQAARVFLASMPTRIVEKPFSPTQLRSALATHLELLTSSATSAGTWLLSP